MEVRGCTGNLMVPTEETETQNIKKVTKYAKICKKNGYIIIAVLSLWIYGYN